MMKICIIQLLEKHLRKHFPAKALFNAIKYSPDRNDRILSVLMKIPDDAIVVFPGWTFYGEAPELFMKAAQKKRLVVYEVISTNALFPDKGKVMEKYPWKTHVIGRSLRNEIHGEQIISNSSEKKDLHKMRVLKNEIISNRCGQLKTGQRVLLLVCGEVVLLSGGGKSGYDSVKKPDLFTDVLNRPFDIVLNPAHTPNGPYANEHKRQWLSRGGVLCTTANCFLSYDFEGSKQSRRIKAEKCYCRKNRLNDDYCFGDIITDGYSVSTYVI